MPHLGNVRANHSAVFEAIVDTTALVCVLARKFHLNRFPIPFAKPEK